MKRQLLAQCGIIKLIGLSLVWGGFVWLGWSVFLCGGFLYFLHLLVPHWQGGCDVFTQFEPTDRTVWLTIDDGPDPEDTPRLLALLAQYQAKATFFLIGERAARHPELVAQIREAGHEIACHTHTHPTRWFWLASRQTTERELDQCLAAIEARRGEVTLYRSPVGIKSMFLARALQERGLQCVGWTIRSGDGVRKDPARIIERVRRLARPGAIVLMHEGPGVAPTVRVAAIAGVLETLTADGYAFILPTADQLRTPANTPTTTTTTKELLCN